MGNVFPRIPGHEIVDDIVEVGEGVSHLKNGDRVGGPGTVVMMVSVDTVNAASSNYAISTRSTV
jgi:D-arabinose 1-dehydrogenase-like Zn-dependent alcohol dehydrogenase